MKNKFKRLSSFLLALLVILTMLPLDVFALDINGDAGGNRVPTSTGSGSYALSTRVLGYRISVVDVAGDRKRNGCTMWENVL